MSGHTGAEPTPPCSRAGERVWHAACDLFYREGIRSVGVAEIAERSGVAKPNLYRNFVSKDGLAVAYLAAHGDAEQALFDRAEATHPDDPVAQLRHVVDALATAVTTAGYRGCPLTNAAAEFPDPDHPVRREIAVQQQRILDRLTVIMTRTAAPDPGRLARTVQLVLAGASVSAQVLDAAATAAALADAVNQLVATATEDSRARNAR